MYINKKGMIQINTLLFIIIICSLLSAFIYYKFIKSNNKYSKYIKETKKIEEKIDKYYNKNNNSKFKKEPINSEKYEIKIEDEQFTFIDLTKNTIKTNVSTPSKGIVIINNDGEKYIKIEKDNLCITKKFNSDTIQVLDKYKSCDLQDIFKVYLNIDKINTDILENYVGDFKKIDISKSFKDIKGEYYINQVNKEIYSIDSKIENGIEYHSLNELLYILNDVKDNKKDIINTKYDQINYLKNSQFKDGAMTSYGPKSSKIIPYFNNEASLGLLSDIGSLKNVRDSIIWQLNNINQTEDINGIIGTIYDLYYIKDGEEIPKNHEILKTISLDNTTYNLTTEYKYDSIDSYASLFLNLLNEYYLKTNDTILLNNYKDTINKIANALDSMFNSELKLTVTKPTYKIFYTMDNIESYSGYLALSNIELVYNDKEKSEFYKKRAEEIKNGIQTNLYIDRNNKTFSSYNYAYNNSSYNRLFFDRIYYPDVQCQIFPIIYGLISPKSDLGKHLYFLHTYYGREKPFTWYNYDNIDKHYPHMESLYMALLYGGEKFYTDKYTIDTKEESLKGLNKLIEINKMGKNKYCWDVAEAGHSLLALNLYINNYNNF